MKHTIEFNLPDDSVQLATHLDAVKQNSNFRTFVDELWNYIRSEYKHGPSTENAHELIEKVREKYIDLLRENDVVDWEKLEEIAHALT
jgi:ABC-type enterochelin transport system ATPase subunit